MSDEGLAYCGVTGFGHYTAFAEMVRVATARRVDPMAYPKVRAIAAASAAAGKSTPASGLISATARWKIKPDAMLSAWLARRF